MHRGGRAAGAGSPVLEPVIRHLLQLLLGAVEGDPVVVGLQIAQLDTDGLAAHAEEGADIDDHRRDLAVAVEDEVANLADVATIDHICDDILHASHHASLEGANLEFVKKCNAQYTVISTASGKYENVPHPTALKRYKDNTVHDVRRTDVDGSWKYIF